jgi:hypothetical protein
MANAWRCRGRLPPGQVRTFLGFSKTNNKHPDTLIVEGF